MTQHTTPLDQPTYPSTQFSLPLPAGLWGQLTADQAAKVTKIQLHFARNVGVLITKALGDVSALLGEADEKADS